MPQYKMNSNVNCYILFQYLKNAWKAKKTIKTENAAYKHILDPISLLHNERQRPPRKHVIQTRDVPIRERLVVCMREMEIAV